MKLELSEQAFHQAWKHFGLGTKPLVLNVLPEGVLQGERRAAEQRAWEELRRAGFGDEVREDDVHGVLLPLHRYEQAFDLTFRESAPSGEQRAMTGLVAVARTRATLAVRADGGVRLAAVPADSAVRALLGVLPEVRPGPGRGVSVRSAAVEHAASQAGSDDRAMTEGLTRMGVRREDARSLVAMAGGPRLAFAQVGAAVMDGGGKRQRAPMVTHCFANAQGWYLFENSTRSGEAWTTIAPIDKQRMAGRVLDLLKTLPR